MTSEAAWEAPVVPEGTLATVRWMTTTSFWSCPFNCWSAVFASAAAELDGAFAWRPCSVPFSVAVAALALATPASTVDFVGFAATVLPAEVTAVRHVTNALHTLFAHVEVSAVAPDVVVVVVVAAVVAADLFPEPHAAVESTIATAAIASGHNLGSVNIGASTPVRCDGRFIRTG